MFFLNRKKPTVFHVPIPVNHDDFAPGRGYLYLIYKDMVDMINKLEDICVYMEYTQPWSDKRGAKQAC